MSEENNETGSSEMTNQVEKSLLALKQLSNELIDLGVNPAALAVSMSLLYVSFVSNFAAATGQTKEIAHDAMVNSIKEMRPYADECFDDACERIKTIKDSEGA